jgi:release factor glutamine methyltransferase
VRGRVAFRRGDLFEVLGGERFDVIVTNPPYVEAGARGSVEAEVGDWEPESALFAGEDGLDIVRRIIGSAADHLESGGLLAIEIGAEQGAAVRELPAPGLVNMRVARDLSGRDRFLLAERENQ